MTFTKPTWAALSAIGQNRILRSSFIWLFFVPIAAKTIMSLKGFSEKHPDIIWVKVIAENLTLPFEWTIFYAAAVCFALGIFVYHQACPSLIRDFKNFAEFRACENGEDALISRYSTWLREGGQIFQHNGEQSSQDEAILQFLITVCKNDPNLQAEIGVRPAWEVVGAFERKADKGLNAWYYLMTKQMNQDKPILRCLITLAFSAGFTCLAVVFTQKLQYVYYAAF